MIRRRCVKTSGEIPTVRTIGGAAAAKVRPVIGVVLPTATNTPAGGSKGRLGLWALRVLVEPYNRLDIYGLIQGRYVTNFLLDLYRISITYIHYFERQVCIPTSYQNGRAGVFTSITNCFWYVCLAWLGLDTTFQHWEAA